MHLALAGAWGNFNKRYGPQTLEEEIESETTLHLDARAAHGEAKS